MLVWPGALVAGQATPTEALPAEAFTQFEASPTLRTNPPPSAPLVFDPRTAEPTREPNPTRGPMAVPKPVPEVVALVPPTPKAQPRGRFISGKASWYCNRDTSRARASSCTNGHPDTAGFNAYAAAGPALREAICGNRDSRCYIGRTVWVNEVKVTLIDYCQCYWRQSNEKLLDLYLDVFESTGGRVTVGW